MLLLVIPVAPVLALAATNSTADNEGAGDEDDVLDHELSFE